MVSTYNGAVYLQQQLDSLLQQTVKIDRIHIRDDGSMDGTQEIIRFYGDIADNITFDISDNIGWRKSFIEALRACPGYDWYAFCDQDDVWLPEKLEVALERLRACPDPSLPCLYAGNAMVSDAQLRPMFKFNREPNDIERLDLPHTMTRDSMAGGLTYVFNGRARDMLVAFPYEGLTGHDRTLMLICKTFGSVRYDFDAYVRYRQHGTNVYGGLIGTPDGDSRPRRLIDSLREDDLRDRLSNGLLDLGVLFGMEPADEDFGYLRLCSVYRCDRKPRAELLLSRNLGAYSRKQDLKLRMKVLCRTY